MFSWTGENFKAVEIAFLYHFRFKYGDKTFHSRLCILQVSQSQEEVWLCLQIMADTSDPSTVGEDANRVAYWQCKLASFLNMTINELKPVVS